MKKNQNLMSSIITTTSAFSITGLLLTAGVVQGGIIPTDKGVAYQQTIFADTYEGDSALAADTGGYKDFLGGTGSIINTTGASGAATDVLQVNKTSSFTGQPGLRLYFTTEDPVDPQSYTLNYNQDYDPGHNHSNYVRISFDWKPVTGGSDAGDSFGTTMRTESAPSTGTGSQKYVSGYFQDYNDPLSGWHLYMRGAGGLNDFLSGGGRGEVYSTGSNPNLVPDGRWYHIVAEFSVPDASENYEWSMAFTPYSSGVLDTAATATTGGSGTFSADALYAYFDIVGAGGTKEYTWYVDNVEASLMVIPEPASVALLLLGLGAAAMLHRRRRRRAEG